jgi:hypothetical protein
MQRLRASLLAAGVAGAALAPLGLAQPAVSAADAVLPHCPRIITRADEGKTLRLKRGTCATLRLSGLSWSRPTSSNADVVVSTAPASSTTQQWLLKGAHLGGATIKATGRPICQPAEACPQFILLYTLKINVIA